MGDRPAEDDARVQAALSEFSRKVNAAMAFREQVFGRDPDALVERHEAAAILGLSSEEVDAEIEAGRLGVQLADGERIIRVRDLRARDDEDQRRIDEFARGLSKLRNEIGDDE